MADLDRKDHSLHEETIAGDGKSFSRREFLKLAGVTGAAVGLGAGLGGLVAACGGDDSGTTGAESSSSVTVGGGGTEGDEIKIGFVSPLTGALASFGVPDQYCVDRWNEAVVDGLVCGDGKNHKIKIILADSQSDSNRAAQVAGDLINNEQVDLILVASTPDTVAPVADQCEANATPCLSNDCPWQPYFFGRNGDPAVGFEWTYHFFWGLEDIIATFSDMWPKVATNQSAGAMWPNDADGNAYRSEFGPALTAAGYSLVDPGAYQNFTEDFTAQINEFKKNGCEIGTGVPQPPDFTNFWKQATQQGFKPKIGTYAKALLFPQSMEALGEVGYNLTTEVWWTPRHPFASSLTGETCQQLADDFEARTGMQWTQPLLHYVVFEMAVDALKRADDPKDKQSIIEAVRTMKLDTVGGPIDFTAPVADGGMRPVPNVYKSPLVGGQWVKGSTYMYDLVVVDNVAAPDIALEAEMQSL